MSYCADNCHGKSGGVRSVSVGQEDSAFLSLSCASRESAKRIVSRTLSRCSSLRVSMRSKPISSYRALSGSGPSVARADSTRYPRPASLPVLGFSAEQLAAQITLADAEVFQRIHADELSSISWNTRDKHVRSPNVVAFTRRFNQVSFWAVKEVLNVSNLKQRSEVLAHMIRVARKLQDLCNLHAQFAILCALQSSPVFRLEKTWSLLPRNVQLKYERQRELFQTENNWANLREFLATTPLPCIPYLGLYLTDLVYIDVVHPKSGGMDSNKRIEQINEVVSTITRFQQSDYSHISPRASISSHLSSRRYIDELQKFADDDNYQLSLKLEPLTTSSPDASTGPPSDENVKHILTPGSSTNSLTSQSNSLRSKHLLNHLPDSDCTDSGNRNLLDDSLLRARWPYSSGNTVYSSGVDDRDHYLDIFDNEFCDAQQPFSAKSPIVQNSVIAVAPNLTRECTLQGVVFRKLLLKDGQRCRFTSWHRYWLQLHRSFLVYFPTKTLHKGLVRSDFGSVPCKHHSVLEWRVFSDRDDGQSQAFVMQHSASGRSYKFRVCSAVSAQRWINHLSRACTRGTTGCRTAHNLISFE